jgi:hypothetical protein
LPFFEAVFGAALAAAFGAAFGAALAAAFGAAFGAAFAAAFGAAFGAAFAAAFGAAFGAAFAAAFGAALAAVFGAAFAAAFGAALAAAFGAAFAAGFAAFVVPLPFAIASFSFQIRSMPHTQDAVSIGFLCTRHNGTQYVVVYSDDRKPCQLFFAPRVLRTVHDRAHAANPAVVA